MNTSFVICGASPTIAPLAFRAVTSVMNCRTSRTVVPLGLRVVSSTRCNHGNEANQEILKSVEQYNIRMSRKAADWEVIKLVKSELKLAERRKDMHQVPENFPFEVKVIPHDHTTVLTRVLDGEKIEVMVNGPYTPRPDPDDDEEEKDSKDTSDDKIDAAKKDGDDKSSQTESNEEKEKEPEIREFDHSKEYILLRIKITKENGKELMCLAKANNGCILVKAVTLDKYNQPTYCPHCWMDEDRQNAWRGYLAARGIEDGIVDYLTKHVSGAQTDQYHLAFLKDLVEFMKN